MVRIKTERDIYLDSSSKRLKIGEVQKHESLFKYITLQGNRSWNFFEQMLKSGQLIGSTITSLNDPFEGSARIIDDLSGEILQECCKYFDKSGQAVDASKSSDFIGFAEIGPETERRTQHTLDSARILSFCRRSDSPLLWSHYAASHQGACLHFTRSAFDDPRLIVGSVRYAINRPSFPRSLLAKISLAPEKDHHIDDRRTLREEFYRSTFYVKPIDWSYEEEVRIIYSASVMTNAPFKLSGLLEIILGYRCSDEDEVRVRELVERYVPRISVRRASIDHDTFSVRFSS